MRKKPKSADEEEAAGNVDGATAGGARRRGTAPMKALPKTAPMKAAPAKEGPAKVLAMKRKKTEKEEEEKAPFDDVGIRLNLYGGLLGQMKKAKTLAEAAEVLGRHLTKDFDLARSYNAIYKVTRKPVGRSTDMRGYAEALIRKVQRA